jgi:hypothetical protein
LTSGEGAAGKLLLAAEKPSKHASSMQQMVGGGAVVATKKLCLGLGQNPQSQNQGLNMNVSTQSMPLNRLFDGLGEIGLHRNEIQISLNDPKTGTN